MRIMVATLFLPPTVPKTSLIVLVFFASLILVDGRLLGVLTTRYVSRRSVSRIILPRVLLLLFCRLVPLETFDMNFAST